MNSFMLHNRVFSVNNVRRLHLADVDMHDVLSPLRSSHSLLLLPTTLVVRIEQYSVCVCVCVRAITFERNGF